MPIYLNEAEKPPKRPLVRYHGGKWRLAPRIIGHFGEHRAYVEPFGGGESGRNARPMHPDWARSLRDQCAFADVPFFFKQWGEHDDQGNLVGKKKAGRILDGREWSQFPEVVNNA